MQFVKMKRTLFDFSFQSSKKTKKGGSEPRDEDSGDTGADRPTSTASRQDGESSSEKCVSGSTATSRRSEECADRGEVGAPSSPSRTRPTTSQQSEGSTDDRPSVRLSTPSTSTESHTQSESTSSRPSVKKKPFQEQWRKKWSWLKLSAGVEGGMQCELCLKHLKKNTLTTKSYSSVRFKMTGC